MSNNTEKQIHEQLKDQGLVMIGLCVKCGCRVWTDPDLVQEIILDIMEFGPSHGPQCVHCGNARLFKQWKAVA